MAKAKPQKVKGSLAANILSAKNPDASLTEIARMLKAKKSLPQWNKGYPKK